MADHIASRDLLGPSSNKNAKEANLARQGKCLVKLNTHMLDTAEYSDLTLKCRGVIFNVHRNVVCHQSEFLAACVNGKWKESQDNNVELDDDDPDTLARLVNFFYTQALNIRTVSSGAIPLPLDQVFLAIAKVYIIADKYDVVSLKQLAVIHFEQELSRQAFSKTPATWNNDKSLPAALRLIYNETPSSDRDLKDVANAFMAEHTELLEIDSFEDVFKNIGEIGIDVLRAGRKKDDSTKPNLLDVRCPECRIGHCTQNVGLFGDSYACKSCNIRFILRKL